MFVEVAVGGSLIVAQITFLWFFSCQWKKVMYIIYCRMAMKKKHFFGLSWVKRVIQGRKKKLCLKMTKEKQLRERKV